MVKNKKTGEYVLSFRGTDDDIDGTDWWDNIAQGGFGATTGQYKNAMDLAIELNRNLPNLTVTGHSLGGGLATAAALAIDKKAVVFNPAGLHPDFINENNLDASKAGQLVTNYTIDGEILSTLQDKGPIYIPTLPPLGLKFDAPSALGTRITLEPDDRWVYQEIGFTLPIEHAITKGVLLHGMEAVQNTLLHQQFRCWL